MLSLGIGELLDPFTIRPDDARSQIELPLEMEHPVIRNEGYRLGRDKRRDGVTPGQRPTAEGSRHHGSFLVLQRYALRALCIPVTRCNSLDSCSCSARVAWRVAS